MNCSYNGEVPGDLSIASPGATRLNGAIIAVLMKGPGAQGIRAAPGP